MVTNVCIYVGLHLVTVRLAKHRTFLH